ncbi:WD40-repeat-containing domain protein [Flammula alnicola]|nr:WD40-repeat-containing domain protein [Flammula alnicola]
MQSTSVQQPRRTYPSITAHGPIRTVAFFPDGKRIVTGGHSDSSTRIWNLDTGEEDGESLRGHTFPTLSVAVSKSGSDVLTGGADNKVFLWDVNNRQAGRLLFSGPIDSQICSVAFNSTTSPTLVASSGSNGIINIWRVKPDMDSTPLKRISIAGNPTISSIQFSPGYPNLIAVASLDKKARVYDAYTGQQKAVFNGHTTFISSLMWFPSGQRIASGGDKTIRMWDSRTGTPTDEPLLGHTQLVKSIAISPQGRFIASGSNDKTLRLWNAITRVQIGSPITHPSSVNLVAFSPDGKSLLSVTEKSNMYLWEMDYLEVEEGVQLARGVIDGLVSFSSDMRAELRGVLAKEFHDIRQYHAQEMEEQRRLFDDKATDDEGRFDELQKALNDVKETQDIQFVALQEALQEATTKQETDIQQLQSAISTVIQKHATEFKELRKAQNEFATQQEAKCDAIQQDLRSLQKGITELGAFIKKLPTARS